MYTTVCIAFLFHVPPLFAKRRVFVTPVKSRIGLAVWFLHNNFSSAKWPLVKLVMKFFCFLSINNAKIARFQRLTAARA